MGYRYNVRYATFGRNNILMTKMRNTKNVRRKFLYCKTLTTRYRYITSIYKDIFKGVDSGDLGDLQMIVHGIG